VKYGTETQISMTIGDADSRAEMLDSHPEGSQRNWREEGLGASKVTARREHFAQEKASRCGRSGRLNAAVSTALSSVDFMNRRIRNRTYGGVGGRRR
jgi:hypothetical protein